MLCADLWDSSTRGWAAGYRCLWCRRACRRRPAVGLTTCPHRRCPCRPVSRQTLSIKAARACHGMWLILMLSLTSSSRNQQLCSNCTHAALCISRPSRIQRTTCSMPGRDDRCSIRLLVYQKAIELWANGALTRMSMIFGRPSGVVCRPTAPGSTPVSKMATTTSRPSYSGCVCGNMPRV